MPKHLSRAQCFPHQNTHKYTRTSLNGKTDNQTYPIRSDVWTIKRVDHNTAIMQNCKQIKMRKCFLPFSTSKFPCLWSCWLAEGVSRQTLLHAVNVDQKVTCFIKFQFSMFYWTFTVAYSTAKLKIKGNKGSPYFTPFIHLATETLKYTCTFL